MSSQARIAAVIHLPALGYIKFKSRAEYESLYGKGHWPCKRNSAFIVHDEEGKPICWGDTPELALTNRECKGIVVQVLLH